jgi:magnesium transporter
VIQSLTLIVSFMPAISALSGNLGLQASANTIRGLGTGHILPNKYCANIVKEVREYILYLAYVE